MNAKPCATVLTIDDEAVVRRGITAYLEDTGFSVLEAENGRVGLEIFRHEHPDVVLIDLRMPEVDGLEVLETLARESPDTGTIVISGTGMMADAVEALHRGAWDYIIKPIEDMAVLLHAVEKVLERACLIRENRSYQKHLQEQIKKRTAELEAANEALTREIEERKRAEQERRTLEAQLRHAQKMEAVGQLAGGVAHDFNNILTTILGNAELTIRALEAEFNSDNLEGLRQIEQSVQLASVLTRQLLAFSRRQVSHPEVLDFNRALAEMEKLLLRLLTEDIHLTMHLPPTQLCIRADAGQIEQVVMNLVVNARDAMPDGGELTLETTSVMLDEAYLAAHAEAKPGAHVMLAVSDTGIGMTKDTLERIFEPFFTTKTAGRGTGLGLATVYGIVKQAGGHIVVYSEPQRGTTFKIYLPAVMAAPEQPGTMHDTSQMPTGTETILVCEDDELVRNLVVRILQGSGYTVLAAENGEQALKLAAEHRSPLHLLITDVIMPDMNGRKLADMLVAIMPKLRTLFVSGYTSNVIARHGVLDEGVEFLAKPFSQRDLLQRVREVLEHPNCVVGQHL
ncbi:MAG: response regulator [Phycisphaerae bacterium]|nr:response regulator [Phycisphaerae bacterium]